MSLSIFFTLYKAREPMMKEIRIPLIYKIEYLRFCFAWMNFPKKWKADLKMRTLF